jgi:BioD-like phosphotransacetylase family protein
MSLVIASTKKNAGKTTVGLGIGQLYPGEVGFFKPVGTNAVSGIDRDVLLFKEVFELEGAPQLYTLSQDYHKTISEVGEHDFTEALKERYDVLSKGKDFMIIEAAHTISYGSYMGLSAPQIASHLECPALLVAAGMADKIIDKSIIARRCFEMRDATLLGVVINRNSSAEARIEAQLTEKGIEILGVIPEYEESNPSLCGDIRGTLDGRSTAEEKGIDERVRTKIAKVESYSSPEPPDHVAIAIEMVEKYVDLKRIFELAG